MVVYWRSRSATVLSRTLPPREAALLAAVTTAHLPPAIRWLDARPGAAILAAGSRPQWPCRAPRRGRTFNCAGLARPIVTMPMAESVGTWIQLPSATPYQFAALAAQTPPRHSS